MAKNNGLDFSELNRFQEKFEKRAKDIKPYVDKSLVESHSHITQNVEGHAQKSYYPAKGKYSSGDTRESIYKNSRVTWVGDTFATVDVGFDYSKSVVPLFLMYGTPRMRPVLELYNDFFSAQARKEIREIQRKNLEKVWEE